MNTLQMCMMSRKNTVAAARNRPTPRLKKNRVTSGYTASIRVRWKGAPVKIMTSSRATKLNTQFTMAKQHFSSGKIYLGIYTFLSSGAALSTLLMLVEVASLKKLNNSWPHIRKTAKLSMPLPRMSIRLLNTAQYTRHISSGFSTLHSTPNALRRYFNLKSFETSDRKMNQSRLKFSLLKGIAMLSLSFVSACALARRPIQTLILTCKP